MMLYAGRDDNCAPAHIHRIVFYTGLDRTRTPPHGEGGLPLDEAKTVELFWSAANLGERRALAKLGNMYEEGRGGLPKDGPLRLCDSDGMERCDERVVADLLRKRARGAAAGRRSAIERPHCTAPPSLS